MRSATHGACLDLNVKGIETTYTRVPCMCPICLSVQNSLSWLNLHAAVCATPFSPPLGLSGEDTHTSLTSQINCSFTCKAEGGVWSPHLVSPVSHTLPSIRCLLRSLVRPSYVQSPPSPESRPSPKPRPRQRGGACMDGLRHASLLYDPCSVDC